MTDAMTMTTHSSLEYISMSEMDMEIIAQLKPGAEANVWVSARRDNNAGGKMFHVKVVKNEDGNITYKSRVNPHLENTYEPSEDTVRAFNAFFNDPANYTSAKEAEKADIGAHRGYLYCFGHSAQEANVNSEVYVGSLRISGSSGSEFAKGIIFGGLSTPGKSAKGNVTS